MGHDNSNRERWQKETYRPVRRKDTRTETERSRTTSDIEIDPVYALRGAVCDARRASVSPASIPFTRGVYPVDVPRAPVDHAAVRRFRRRARDDQRAVPVPAGARARPGSRWPSTCPPRWATTPTTRMAAGEVGRVGVAIDTIDDLRDAASTGFPWTACPRR